MPFKQGDIVWVYRALDEHGRNPKKRPVVILTSTEEITDEDEVVGVAVTHTLPPDISGSAVFVALPWNSRGTTRTGLTKRSAAKCDWLVIFHIDQVDALSGDIDQNTLLRILERLPSENAD